MEAFFRTNGTYEAAGIERQMIETFQLRDGRNKVKNLMFVAGTAGAIPVPAIMSDFSSGLMANTLSDVVMKEIDIVSRGGINRVNIPGIQSFPRINEPNGRPLLERIVDYLYGMTMVRIGITHEYARRGLVNNGTYEAHCDDLMPGYLGYVNGNSYAYIYPNHNLMIARGVMQIYTNADPIGRYEEPLPYRQVLARQLNRYVNNGEVPSPTGPGLVHVLDVRLNEMENMDHLVKYPAHPHQGRHVRAVDVLYENRERMFDFEYIGDLAPKVSGPFAPVFIKFRIDEGAADNDEYCVQFETGIQRNTDLFREWVNGDNVAAPCDDFANVAGWDFMQNPHTMFINHLLSRFHGPLDQDDRFTFGRLMHGLLTWKTWIRIGEQLFCFYRVALPTQTPVQYETFNHARLREMSALKGKAILAFLSTFRDAEVDYNESAVNAVAHLLAAPIQPVALGVLNEEVDNAIRLLRVLNPEARFDFYDMLVNQKHKISFRDRLLGGLFVYNKTRDFLDQIGDIHEVRDLTRAGNGQPGDVAAELEIYMDRMRAGAPCSLVIQPPGAAPLHNPNFNLYNACVNAILQCHQPDKPTREVLDLPVYQAAI